jgi:hypothetical protein
MYKRLREKQPTYDMKKLLKDYKKNQYYKQNACRYPSIDFYKEKKQIASTLDNKIINKKRNIKIISKTEKQYYPKISKTVYKKHDTNIIYSNTYEGFADMKVKKIKKIKKKKKKFKDFNLKDLKELNIFKIKKNLEKNNSKKYNETSNEKEESSNNNELSNSDSMKSQSNNEKKEKKEENENKLNDNNEKNTDNKDNNHENTEGKHTSTYTKEKNDDKDNEGTDSDPKKSSNNKNE